MAITALSVAVTCACAGKQSSSENTPDTFKEQGDFNPDSAFAFVKLQTDCGPRVPGTVAHDKCADLLISKLQSFGADTVYTIDGSATAWDGTPLPIRNIFARFNVNAAARVILLAHYDTRPWADNDPDPANRHTPIDGANDGGSGVAVLLEVARNLGISAPQIGVDILLTDCEDYGAHQQADVAESSDTWCLGSMFFADNLPYSAADLPRFGILLDMVGGADAKFNKEYFSSRYASTPTAKVWAMAQRLGLSSRFPTATGGAITDDHLPLIRAGIPVTNIVESANPVSGSFPPTWHTLHDNIDNIDTATMQAVGRVVLNVIYNEKL